MSANYCKNELASDTTCTSPKCEGASERALRKPRKEKERKNQKKGHQVAQAKKNAKGQRLTPTRLIWEPHRTQPCMSSRKSATCMAKALLIRKLTVVIGAFPHLKMGGGRRRTAHFNIDRFLRHICTSSRLLEIIRVFNRHG